MLRFWPLLFIIVPLLELYLIIEIGSRIGALLTVLIVITTAIIGVQLLRYQSFSTLNRARSQMAQGAMPATEMIEGLVLAVGGALLITPGFLTDTLGFLCLIPFTRRALVRRILAGSTIHMSGHVSGHHGTQPPPRQDSPHPSPHKGRTIEGDYHRDDP